MTRCVISASAIAALAPVFLGASQGVAPAHTAATASPGYPATFAWGDADRDGRLEMAAVDADGVLRVLTSAGADRFEDVSERMGLSGIGDASLALWVDYDADGRLDLFVGARAGASRLFHNEGGLFVDMSAAAGIATEGAVNSADWLDHDGDGRTDLHVVTAKHHELYRGLEGGMFERMVLPLAGAPAAARTAGDQLDARSSARTERDRDEADGDHASDTGGRSRTRVGDRATTDGSAALTSVGGSSVPLPAPLFACATAIRDQANPNSCLDASTTPTLGSLYPISSNLFVAVSGDVGIGTTTPTAKLHVAGTSRMTNTVTLAPSGDTALDVSTGSIYKAGALFIHTKGGTASTAVGTEALRVNTAAYNTAVGFNALFGNTNGGSNTAVGSNALRSNNGYFNTANGDSALRSNTSGEFNTATGYNALKANTTALHNTAHGASALAYTTTGFYNTAVGSQALRANTTGANNTANGVGALYKNTTGGYNTASGRSALFFNTGGARNTAIGNLALVYNSTGDDNTALGRSALRNNTTADGNTASGTEALRNNTTGSSNTAHGRSALYTNVIGTRNTASGFEALRANTASDNTAHGADALRSNTTGSGNTAQGVKALRLNTTGSFNNGVGRYALYYNTTGVYNTATGMNALTRNTTASRNSAHGAESLHENTTGADNTADGCKALRSNTTGSRNIALGKDAGLNLTTGNDNIDIGNVGVAAEGATIRVGTAGTHTRAFVAGIRGVTTGSANGIAVLIDSNGQLGTVSSSRRFKKDIADMGDRTERLLDLRPVVFRYRQEQTMPDGSEVPVEYGLIAEEVAEVFPDLVVYDDEGQPFTVKYHILSAMLLNELEKVHARVAEQSSDLASQMRAIDELRARLARLEARGSPVAQPADLR